MIRKNLFLLALVVLVACSATRKSKVADGWISLFDGTFSGWKFSEKPGTFKIEDGSIVVNGPRSHLYYDGPVMNHNFKNFEVKAQVMTKPGSNSGSIFIQHTRMSDFPTKDLKYRSTTHIPTGREQPGYTT